MSRAQARYIQVVGAWIVLLAQILQGDVLVVVGDDVVQDEVL